MTAATVIIPTHEHVEPLRLAIESVLQQNLQDFELFVIGDGVKDDTRTLVSEACAADRRIRFFNFPKSPRKGERYRHEALKQAKGRFVAYLGDDDIWMPNHLEVLDALLMKADFGHTLQIGITADGTLAFRWADLENPEFRKKMLNELFNCFDITFAGHTLDAYRRLPHGWVTTPPEFPWHDLYMWRQFLGQPWCRARSAMVPTGINTWTHLRPHLTDRVRAEELIFWRGEIAKPDFREKFWQQIMLIATRELVDYQLVSSSSHDLRIQMASLNAELLKAKTEGAAHAMSAALK